jgi:hypothetical protein
MATGYETILAAVEARLTSPTDFVDGSYGTRRGHLTPIPRDQAPAAHIVGGDDDPLKGNACGGRVGDFTVSIYTRDDEGSRAADPYLLELYARMAEPFAAGIVVKPAGIRRETEIADGDAARTDCRFEVEYPTAGEWSLELPE